MVSSKTFPSRPTSTDNRAGTDRNAGLPPNLYAACNPSASASMCCALDSTSYFLNGKSGTICRSDGLCANGNGQYITRTACTDLTWQSPDCVKLCINGTNQAGNDMFITPCNDGSYCCGNNAVAIQCCADGQGVFVVNGDETMVNPNPVTSRSTSSTASTTQTTTANASAAPQGTASSSPNTLKVHRLTVAGLIGSIVGGVLGVLLIAGTVWYLASKKRKPRPSSNVDDRWAWENGSKFVYEAPTHAGETLRIELPGPAVSRPELMDSGRYHYEMDDRHDGILGSTKRHQTPGPGLSSI